METQEANVHVGDGVVVIRRKGSSIPAVAKILGSAERAGRQHLYLDRLVHKPHENELGGYAVHGAISSIMVVPQAQVLAPADA
ncbi:hypothetical protein [Massilia sp. LjRoot122]|uniref:hypothetical protein n=1 Tax=Massilia sp. LjRoot122 TaxID=3342257 RepID=UPI003ECE0787